MERDKQRKVVDIDKGLLLVRYTGAEDEVRPPKVSVVVNPKHERHIQLVSNPLYPDAVMWQPGSCVVVRAARPGQLFVEVAPSEPAGSKAATVQIEALSQGEAIEMRPVSRRAGALETMSGHLRVLGHVAGVGDVTVGPDEWIAGPSAPARIEGLSIDWPEKPDDLDIRYSVKLARPHAASERRTGLGGYAGTRGRALPVVGVSIELSGAAAGDFRLSAEAAFLSSPITRTRGEQIVLAGPTGREPLVGFRLRLEEVSVPLQPNLPSSTQTSSSGGVRVFRSRAAQTSLRSRLQTFADSLSERAAG